MHFLKEFGIKKSSSAHKTENSESTSDKPFEIFSVMNIEESYFNQLTLSDFKILRKEGSSVFSTLESRTTILKSLP